MRLRLVYEVAVLVALAAVSAGAQGRLPVEKMADEAYEADAAWYRDNVPFFEVDDPAIQAVYAYRWKVYRSHLRDIGAQHWMALEFLPDVSWARHPYTDLNDSSGFHLVEGRWLRDPRVVASVIDHLYAGAGNDRHFSEWVAAASYAATEVTGDREAALKHLDAMQYVYNAWDDHFDRERGLYWIEPLADATEYTIASIDASGAGFIDTPSTDSNKNGFTQGFAYRPSINAYQYGNARAIAALAREAGMPEVAADYDGRADRLRAAVRTQLWNAPLGHFTDVYQQSTATVKAGRFVRGRELVGYTPWMFEGMAGEANDGAWRHAFATDELAGAKGLRTVEPTYAKYMRQYRYDRETGRPECQWNGPSWPFQTSETLMGMAGSAQVTDEEYLGVLRQFALQHYRADGVLDLQEDYDPDKGGAIVGLGRSHHYEHSTFNDLVLTGLVGIRPRADEVLEVRPRAGRLKYFAVERLVYHGHEVGIYYDRDGNRYGLGKGLTVFVDGRRAPPGLEVQLGERRNGKMAALPTDLFANPGLPQGPQVTASSTLAGTRAAEAVDGRMWFFPEIANGWSPQEAGPSWLTVDLREPKKVGRMELYLTGAAVDGRVQVRAGEGWKEVAAFKGIPGGTTGVRFAPVTGQQWKVLFGDGTFRVLEVKAFAE